MISMMPWLCSLMIPSVSRELKTRETASRELPTSFARSVLLIPEWIDILCCLSIRSRRAYTTRPLTVWRGNRSILCCSIMIFFDNCLISSLVNSVFSDSLYSVLTEISKTVAGPFAMIHEGYADPRKAQASPKTIPASRVSTMMGVSSLYRDILQ